MMGRLSNLVSWFRDLFGRTMSPKEKLENMEEEYIETLDEVRQGIADVTTQKKRLEIQRRELKKQVSEKDSKARKYVGKNEDRARSILRRKKRDEKRVQELTSQIENLDKIQQSLVTDRERISSKISEIRNTRTRMQAKRKAAEAHAEVSDVMSGVGGKNIESHLDQMQREIEELEAKSEVYGDNTDIDVGAEVEEELEMMKERN